MAVNKMTAHAKAPIAISIQTITSCNISCSICPHSTLYQGSPVCIHEDLWNKIIQEASKIESLVYIYVTLHNEPLTDPHIFRRISEVNSCIKDKREKWSAVITNGKALQNKETRNKLRAARPGVLYISLASGNPLEYERITGLQFDITVNIIKIMSQLVDNVTILVTKTKNTNTEQIRELIHTGTGCDTIGIQFNPLVTNGGLSPHCKESSISPFKHQFGDICPHPFQFINICVDGSYIICCFDWERYGIIGNVNNNSIMEIYNSALMSNIRNEMTHGIYRYPMCHICSKEFGFRQGDICE